MTLLQENCIVTPAITTNFEKEMKQIQLTKLRSSRLPYNSQVVIPRVYVDDNNLMAGSEIEIYRGTINEQDAIVILPSTAKLNDIIYKNLVNVDEKQ